MCVCVRESWHHCGSYKYVRVCAVQDIVLAIVNSGQQFTEQQYVTVLSLSHRSEYGCTDAELESRLAKLNAILVANAADSLAAAAADTTTGRTNCVS